MQSLLKHAITLGMLTKSMRRRCGITTVRQDITVMALSWLSSTQVSITTMSILREACGMAVLTILTTDMIFAMMMMTPWMTIVMERM